MHVINERLGKRYAQALYNLHTPTLSTEFIEQLRSIATFFAQHPQLPLVLELERVQAHHLPACMAMVTQKAHVPSVHVPLLVDLAKKHRLSLLEPIARYLEQLVDAAQNRRRYTVYSSHPLQEDQKQTILSFVQAQAPETQIEVSFEEKPNLICGVRIISNEMMWERSVRKTFLQITQRLLARI